jgi:drug/metabolite transporter (DMT)-like permease
MGLMRLIPSRVTVLLPVLLPALIPALFVLLWSAGFIAAKIGLSHSGALSYVFLRFALAALMMCLIALALRAKWPHQPRLIGHIVVAGLLQHAIYLTPNFWVMDHGFPAALVALIGALQPLLTAVLAGWLLGERAGLRQWLGLLVGLLGVVMVLSDSIAFDWRSPLDAALVLLGMVSLTLGTIWQKRCCAQMDLLAGSAVQLLAATLFAGLAMLLFEGFDADFSLPFNLSLFYMSCMSVLLYTLMHAMFRGAQAARVASLFYLIPPVTALMTWFAIGERMGGLAMLGMAVTVAGVAMAVRRQAL